MKSMNQARVERDNGMAISVGHAESEAPGWSDRAYEALEAFARQHGSFTAEKFRHQSGLEIPTTGKALGSVFRRAARAGLIEKGGFEPSRDRHLSPAVSWNSLVFGE